MSDLAGGMLLSKWLQQVGISRMTGWRLRKEGKLTTITRYVRIYVTAAGMKEFFKDDGSKPRSAPQRRAVHKQNKKNGASVDQPGGEAVAERV